MSQTKGFDINWRYVMKRKVLTPSWITLATIILLVPANAEVSRRGGQHVGEVKVISAEEGAKLVKSMEARARGFYWFQDRCWNRRADGSYISVPNANCTVTTR
jgi:hypothetical protein